MNKYVEYFDLALENIKKNEISLIIVENLKYDENKMKVIFK
jgi:hypothetical protein